jgi:hypothetical protein
MSTEIDAPEWSDGLETKQVAFLEAFCRWGSVSRASQGICHRTAHYRWLEESELYRRNFETARKAFGDVLMEEAIFRAVRGPEEPVLIKGQQALDPQGNPITRRRTDRFLLKHLLSIHHATKHDTPAP